mmetsp:Transcript_58210/g.127638  ORF Transcript_58210/g.127638 Transcript_58210/m.127638 type:complete len:489 (+) Transcript_58210:59-1525(+)
MNLRTVLGLFSGYGGLTLICYSIQQQRYKQAASVAVLMYVLGRLCSGMTNWLTTALFGFPRKPAAVVVGDGVKPGWEHVRDVYVKHFEQGLEIGSQLVVYYKGERVVDLAGSIDHPTTKTYDCNALQNVFSSSKVVASICVAMLAARGHVRYDQKVAEIWPEFAQNGKGDITVAEVMRHEAGCVNLSETLLSKDLTAERIRAGAVSDQLAAQVPKWPKDTRREYHAETRGFFINEIFRRCHPQGLTVGQFLQQEVLPVVGIPGSIYFGVPESQDDRRAPMVPHPTTWGALHALLPTCLGSLVKQPYLMHFLFYQLPPIFMWLGKGQKPNFDEDLKPRSTVDKYNAASTRRAEVLSAAGYASARGLSRLAWEVCSVQLGQKSPLISKEGMDAAMGNPVTLKTFFGLPTTFTNAGLQIYSKDKGMLRRGESDGWVGWMGYGGSVMQWLPEKQVSVGYAMNLMEPDIDNQRAHRLQSAIEICIDRLEGRAQ